MQPDSALDAGARLGDLLTFVTRRWYHDFVQASYRFEDVERPQDRWIDVICKLPPDYESWTARVFILWGRHILPDLIAELLDGEAEAYLDGEYADLVNEFDEYQMEERLRKLDVIGDVQAGVDVTQTLHLDTKLVRDWRFR
jgi:hypothetical protein